MSELDDRPKKLGELLVGAGLVPADRLSEGLEYARKHSLPLGRVLITLRLLKEEDLESALHSQALMKMDRLPARLAVRAIAAAASNHIPIDRALKQMGWFSDKYVEGEAISIAVAREQLTVCEASFGPDHPETAVACMRLAELLTDNRKYLDAELLYNRAAKIIEECFGQQSLEMSNLLSQLGGNYFAQDRFEEAEKLYWQAYEIKRSLLGEKHLAVAQCLEDLAELYDVQSEYLQAERFYLSSIGIKEQLLEADDPELISSLRKLVLICRQQDHSPESKQTGELLIQAGMLEEEKLAEGLELAQKYKIPLGRALVSLKQLSQDDLQRAMHAQLLMKDGGIPGYLVIRALKTSCRMNKSVGQALKLLGWRRENPADQKHLELLLRCSDALIKLEQERGPDHIDVARKCTELADLYAGAENLREAEILLKRALRIYMDQLGEDDEATASTLSNLAQVHCRQKRYDEASNMLERAINQARKRAPAGSPELADYLERKARILHASGNCKEALMKVTELLTLARKLEKSESNHVSHLLELQGDLQMSMEKYDEAQKSYEKSLVIREKGLISGNPQVTGLLHKLGEVQIRKGKLKAALPHFERARELVCKLFGDTHPLNAMAELKIAECYAAMKDHKKARAAFEKAIDIMQAISGEEETAFLLEQYSAYLKEAGQQAEAKKVDKRIAEIRTRVDARTTAVNLKVWQ